MLLFSTFRLSVWELSGWFVPFKPQWAAIWDSDFRKVQFTYVAICLIYLRIVLWNSNWIIWSLKTSALNQGMTGFRIRKYLTDFRLQWTFFYLQWAIQIYVPVEDSAKQKIWSFDVGSISVHSGFFVMRYLKRKFSLYLQKVVTHGKTFVFCLIPKSETLRVHCEHLNSD